LQTTKHIVKNIFFVTLLPNPLAYCYYYYYRFTAPWTVSGTTQVSRYHKGKTRKVKPIWICWSKRYWVAVASAGHMQITPASHHSVFTGRMPFLPPNQQGQSTLAYSK